MCSSAGAALPGGTAPSFPGPAEKGGAEGRGRERKNPLHGVISQEGDESLSPLFGPGAARPAAPGKVPQLRDAPGAPALRGPEPRGAVARLSLSLGKSGK